MLTQDFSRFIQELLDLLPFVTPFDEQRSQTHTSESQQRISCNTLPLAISQQFPIERDAAIELVSTLVEFN